MNRKLQPILEWPLHIILACYKALSVKYSSNPKTDEKDPDRLICSAKLKQCDRDVYQVRTATKNIIQLRLLRPILATPRSSRSPQACETEISSLTLTPLLRLDFSCKPYNHTHINVYFCIDNNDDTVVALRQIQSCSNLVSHSFDLLTKSAAMLSRFLLWGSIKTSKISK